MSNDPAERIPDSFSDLLKMQNLSTEKVNKVIDLIDELELEPVEILDLTGRLLECLEDFHAKQIELNSEDDGEGVDLESICGWVVDRDRLRMIQFVLRGVAL